MHAFRLAAQKLIPLSAPAEWAAALEGIPHGFAHTWANCHAMHLTTGLRTYLYSFEGGSTRIVCPLAEREFEGSVDVVTPYGFSGFVGTDECPGFPEQWRRFARQRGYVCGYIGQHPLLWRDSYAFPDDVYFHNSIYVLDLKRSADEMLANMSKGRKHELRAWARTSARLVEDPKALSAFFIQNHADFLAARAASRATYLGAETIAALANADSVLWLGAAVEGDIQAVILITYTSAVGEALFLISAPGGQRHSAALFWQGALRLKALGVPLMSMGGGVHENDGVAKFKQHFGALRVPIRSLKQVYNPQTFQRLCQNVGVDPEDCSGYFPQYRNQ